jgi:hypothetical protein
VVIFIFNLFFFFGHFPPFHLKCKDTSYIWSMQEIASVGHKLSVMEVLCKMSSKFVSPS